MPKARFSVTLLTGALLAPSLARAQAPLAQQPSAASEISASGTADIRLTPDRASIYVTIETRNKTATAAMAANTRAVTAVVDALHRAGVAESSLTTSDRSVQQEYADLDRRGPPTPDGFLVRTSLRVETEDVTAISKLVDAALAGGATRIGVQYSSSKMAGARRAALGAAFDAAYADAAAIARAAGGRLGRLLSAVPNGASPVFFRGASMLDEVQVTGIAGGNASFALPPASVASNVTVVARWEFFPGATVVPPPTAR